MRSVVVAWIVFIVFANGITLSIGNHYRKVYTAKAYKAQNILDSHQKDDGTYDFVDLANDKYSYMREQNRKLLLAVANRYPEDYKNQISALNKFAFLQIVFGLLAGAIVSFAAYLCTFTSLSLGTKIAASMILVGAIPFWPIFNLLFEEEWIRPVWFGGLSLTVYTGVYLFMLFALAPFYLNPNRSQPNKSL